MRPLSNLQRSTEADSKNNGVLRKQVLLRTGVVLGSYLTVALLAIRDFLTVPGVIGLRHDWSTPPFDYQIGRRMMEPFFLWSSNGYSIDVPSLTYYRLFEDLLILVSSGADFHISKLVILALIAMAGTLAYLSLRLLKFNFLSSFLVGLFYLSTPLVFNRVLAGHLPYLFAYALMPLIVTLFILGMREKSLKKALLAGVLFAFAISQLQFVIMISILAIAVTCLYVVRIRRVEPLKYLLVTVGFAIGMHSFWLMPYIVASDQSALEVLAPAGYQDIVNAPSVQQAFSLIGYPHQYDYSRILSTENQAFLVLPVLIGLSSFAFKETNPMWKDLRLLGVIAILIGVFLVTTIKSPLGELWSFLYDNISLMRLFREAYHAAALISFGIFILMAITIQKATSLLNIRKVIPVVAALSITIVMLAHPVYSGNFRGQLQTYDFPAEYDLSNYDIDYDSSRLLMFPSFDPVRYNSLEKAHIDPMLSYPPGHSFPQTATPDNRLSQYRNFLLGETGDADFINELQIANVGTVVVRKDVSPAYFDLVPKNPGGVPYSSIADTNDKLAAQLEKIHENEKVVIYSSPSEGFINMSQNLTLVSGNYKVLGSILRTTNTSIVLVSDLLLDESLADYLRGGVNHGTIIVQGDELDEFFIAYSKKKVMVFPTSENLLPSEGWTSTPLATWWWKQAFLHQPSPYNNIVFNTGESTNANLIQNIRLKEDGTYKIFVHLFDNDDGGSLRLSIDNASFERNTESELNRFSWRELGNISLSHGDHTLTLENVRGLNAVNAITLIPVDEYEQSRVQFLNALENKNIVYVFDADSDLFNDGSRLASDSTHVSVPKILEYPSRDITIVKEGFYYLSLTGKGTFTARIDDKSFIIDQGLPSYSEPHLLYLDKGRHRLEITPPTIVNKADDLGLDGLDIEQSDKWSFESVQDFEFELDDDDAYDTTIEVRTSATNRHWSWIRSAPIPVEGNEEYLAATRMKLQNTNSSHIKLEGYYPDSNEWRQLNPFIAAGGTGTSDWREYSGVIRIPYNVTDIRIVLNAGWVLDEGKGEAMTVFDDVRFYKVNDLPSLESTLLYSTSGEESAPPLPVGEATGEVISFLEKNPTLWTAKISAKEPFILTFAEGYDTRWEATVYKDGEKIATAESIPLYSAINGFRVNEIGDLEITIQYKPQISYNFGGSIAMLTIVGGLGYFGYAFFRENVSKLQQAEGV